MHQRISLIGNLGRDPEMRYTSSGSAVTNFSLATNRSWTNSEGEKVTETVWFNVATWGKLAEVCNEYLLKGNLVLVEGRLVANEQGNPKVFELSDGTPAARFEISAELVRFLNTRKGEGTSQKEEEEEDITANF